MSIEVGEWVDAYQGLSEQYARYRPSYPDICISALADYLQKASTVASVIVDVASGTGIATRQLHSHFYPDYDVVGIEPSVEMRAEAERLSRGTEIRYLSGVAEQLPLPAQSSVCVVAAQSIWWFDRAKFYQNASRVLCGRGVLAVLNNNRNWRQSRFFDEYESLLEAHGPRYDRSYRKFDIQRDVLESNLFSDAVALAVEQTITVDFDAFWGLSCSDSKVNTIIREIGHATYRSVLGRLFERHENAVGCVDLLYTTELYLFRKG